MVASFLHFQLGIIVLYNGSVFCFLRKQKASGGCALARTRKNVAYVTAGSDPTK